MKFLMISDKNLPGSVNTSFAAAISINFFSAFFFSSSSENLSGCHFAANFRNFFNISGLPAFLKLMIKIKCIYNKLMFHGEITYIYLNNHLLVKSRLVQN